MPIVRLCLFLSLWSTWLSVNAQNMRDATEFIQGMQGTCVAYDDGGRGYSMTFNSLDVSGTQATFRMRVAAPASAGGGVIRSVQEVDLSDLDPTPEFASFAAVGNSIDVLRFNCTSGACVVQHQSGKSTSFVQLPACIGKERLARAMAALITAAGGRKSKF